MIVCTLIGGLGNQMFQYAYAEELSRKLNDDICFDLNFYNGKKPSLFTLNINNRNTVSHMQLTDFSAAQREEKIYHAFQYVIRKLNHEKIGRGMFQMYSKRGYYFNFDPFYYPSVECKKDNKYIYGYFQGIEYFEESQQSIRKQFVAEIGERAQAYGRKIQSCEAVAIHIRMGDYQEKRNQYMNVCTDNYYDIGIKYISRKIGNAQFFVFTNDEISVRKKSYIPKNAVIINGTKDYEDLMLMKMCKHFIISGSTFSWWGSFLSGNDSKITVAPQMWMTTLREEPAIMKRGDIIRIEV